MQTFKQHLEERTDQAQALVAMIKAGKFQYREDLGMYLDGKPWVKQLGTGFYSVAMAGRSNELVLKMSKGDSKQKEDPWWEWAEKFVYGSSGNKLKPVIYWLGSLPDGARVCFVERLEMGPPELDSPYFAAVDAWEAHQQSKGLNAGSSYWSSRSFFETFARTVANKENPERFFGDGATWESLAAVTLTPLGIDYKDWMSLFSEAASLQTAFRPDLHINNFAKRPNGDTVIMDPFANINA